MYFTTMDSPIGMYLIGASERGITYVDRFKEGDTIPEMNESPLLIEAKKQLEAYFSGASKDFDLPLDTAGTPFQESVWEALRAIPYGQTVSYKDIAVAVNNRNPISIITQCHRVIGISGKLVGYGGGMDAKEYLLKLERENS